jgi:hypothetical protein
MWEQRACRHPGGHPPAKDGVWPQITAIFSRAAAPARNFSRPPQEFSQPTDVYLSATRSGISRTSASFEDEASGDFTVRAAMVSRWEV